MPQLPYLRHSVDVSVHQQTKSTELTSPTYSPKYSLINPITIPGTKVLGTEMQGIASVSAAEQDFWKNAEAISKKWTEHLMAQQEASNFQQTSQHLSDLAFSLIARAKQQTEGEGIYKEGIQEFDEEYRQILASMPAQLKQKYGTHFASIREGLRNSLFHEELVTTQSNIRNKIANECSKALEEVKDDPAKYELCLKRIQACKVLRPTVEDSDAAEIHHRESLARLNYTWCLGTLAQDIAFHEKVTNSEQYKSLPFNMKEKIQHTIHSKLRDNAMKNKLQEDDDVLRNSAVAMEFIARYMGILKEGKCFKESPNPDTGRPERTDLFSMLSEAREQRIISKETHHKLIEETNKAYILYEAKQRKMQEMLQHRSQAHYNSKDQNDLAEWILEDLGKNSQDLSLSEVASMFSQYGFTHEIDVLRDAFSYQIEHAKTTEELVDLSNGYMAIRNSPQSKKLLGGISMGDKLMMEAIYNAAQSGNLESIPSIAARFREIMAKHRDPEKEEDRTYAMLANYVSSNFKKAKGLGLHEKGAAMDFYIHELKDKYSELKEIPNQPMLDSLIETLVYNALPFFQDIPSSMHYLKSLIFENFKKTEVNGVKEFVPFAPEVVLNTDTESARNVMKSALIDRIGEEEYNKIKREAKEKSKKYFWGFIPTKSDKPIIHYVPDDSEPGWFVPYVQVAYSIWEPLWDLNHDVMRIRYWTPPEEISRDFP
jgi:hypothetical protein